MNVDKEKLAAEVIKYRNGDSKAFEAIYNMTNQAAYFTALKIVKNEDDAQDVLQDSYVKVLDKLSTLDKPESFMSWFNMLVANTAKNYLAKNNPVLFADEETEMYVLESIPEENEVYVPGNSVEKDELCDDVMSLIEGLSDDKRTAVVLYYYNEMTTKQIAESLGVNENTVKSRIVQAKKDLAAGIRALEKKNKSILGIAPMSVVRWALNYNDSDAYQKELPDFAPLLEKIQGLESHGFSVLEKLKFRVADLFSHFGTGAGAHHDKGAVFKSAAAVVATAGVVGGAVAGTNAIKNRNSDIPSETTTAYVQEVAKTENENNRTIERNIEVPTSLPLDKAFDTVHEKGDLKYGVTYRAENYVRRDADGNLVVEKGKIQPNYAQFNADYDDLLPAARENALLYSGESSNILSAVNSARSSYGKSKLKFNSTLSEQAGVRAEEIAYSAKNSDTRPDGSSYTSVFDRNGYTSGTRYELRAYGQKSANAAAEIILEKHGEIINNDNITDIGIGISETPDESEYVVVVHLYSARGNAVNGSDFSNKAADAATEGIIGAIDNLRDMQDSLEKLEKRLQTIPVLGSFFSYDFHNDWVFESINKMLGNIEEEETVIAQ